MIAIALLYILALPIVLILWSAISLSINLARAKAIGVPVLVRWITPSNPLWMAWGSKAVRLCRCWGIATEKFDRFYLFGWEANERYRVHAELGDIFMVVSPGGNWLYIADPDAVWDTLKRPHGFGRNLEQFGFLDIYGKNLSTTEGQDWQRHRKVTASAFTDRNNELVWESALAQAKGMLDYWMHRSSQPVRSVADDTKTFTLNVAAAALFSKPYPFEGVEESNDRRTSGKANDASRYRDSLSGILKNIIPIAVFGSKTLKESSWLPVAWKHAGEAVYNFRSFVTGLIQEEKSNVEKGVIKRNDLVAALVRASMEGGKEGKQMTMTEEEVISNTFIIAFAGNDSTAITFAHSIMYLAANPQVQDWISEEIQHYFGNDDSSDWPYKSWANLKRTRAVVMESLRLCHPLMSSSKRTKGVNQLRVGNTTYTIPARTMVQLNWCGLHTNNNVWGESVMKWDPARFIETSTTDTNSANPFELEKLKSSTEKTYMPWAYGERSCPGKKFSQVELAAAIAYLFRNHRVDPVPEGGETLAEARRRALGVSMDIQQTLLCEMYQPQSVGLKWTERVSK